MGQWEKRQTEKSVPKPPWGLPGRADATAQAQHPGATFQGLPVVSDRAGRAHPLGRGFAHLAAEPAPLGHRQRVDDVHLAASSVGLQDGCPARTRRTPASRDRHRAASFPGFQAQGGGAWLHWHLECICGVKQQQQTNKPKHKIPPRKSRG